MKKIENYERFLIEVLSTLLKDTPFGRPYDTNIMIVHHIPHVL